MSAVINIENLTKDYEIGFWRKRQVRALDSLSLRIEQGETFGFLGANGAGKTTTIKLLMRLMFPTGGQAQILGRDIGDVAMHRFIGYLPEHPYFYDYLTAREFLEYCGQLFSYSLSERRRRAGEMLERVRLDAKSWDKQMRRFSKGMLQRVGLAQALINNPEVVFLDEPMSGLDPVGRREVRDLIADLRARGTTVFLCSHILSDIEVLCDRAGVMRKGRLEHLGTIDELRSRGSDGRMEMILAASDSSAVHETLAKAAEAQLAEATPGGVRVIVARERDIATVLACAQACGARLVSVNPVGSRLEDLFVREGGEVMSDE